MDGTERRGIALLVAAVFAIVVGLIYGTAKSRIKGDMLSDLRAVLFWLSLWMPVLGLTAWFISWYGDRTYKGADSFDIGAISSFSILVFLLAGLLAVIDTLVLFIIAIEAGIRRYRG